MGVEEESLGMFRLGGCLEMVWGIGNTGRSETRNLF